MDPNATLYRMLDRARAIIAAIDEGSENVADDANELAEAVENLDEWIRRGGFLPDAWDAGTCGRGAE